MKILFVQGEHPQGKVGGAELQSWLLAKELTKKQHQVTFLAIRSDVKEDTVSIIDGVRVVRLVKKKKYSFREFLVILQAVKKLAPDLIHLRIFEYVSRFVLISRLIRTPVVIHISHTFDCRFIDERERSKVRHHARHVVNHLLLRLHAGIVCQTQEQKAALGTMKLPICVINNSAQPTALSNGLMRKVDNLILWVGNIKSIKQPLLFLELAGLLRDEALRFLMIGYPQDGELTKKIETLSRELPNFEFIPGVPVDQIDFFFRKARLLVCTSAGEGYPNTFIQAMQAGTPIVSLSVDPDDVLKKYGVGLKSGTLNKLQQDLVLLLKDKSLLLAMQKNMKKCLRDNFSVESNANALEQFFLSYSATEIEGRLHHGNSD